MSSIDHGKGNDNVKDTAKGKLGRGKAKRCGKFSKGTGGAAECVYEGRAGLLLMSIALAPVDCPPGLGPWSDDEGEGEFHFPLLSK